MSSADPFPRFKSSYLGPAARRLNHRKANIHHVTFIFVDRRIIAGVVTQQPFKVLQIRYCGSESRIKGETIGLRSTRSPIMSIHVVGFHFQVVQCTQKFLIVTFAGSRQIVYVSDILRSRRSFYTHSLPNDSVAQTFGDTTAIDDAAISTIETTLPAEVFRDSPSKRCPELA